MVTLSKSSWRGCRRPKPQHSQQRPWVKCFWVKVVDRLPKASGMGSLTRMMSPVNSGSKSSVEPGWTFPVEKTSISTRDHWSDTWQRRVWGNAKIRDILQLHPIHLLARDSWSHPVGGELWTLPWPPTGDKCCIFQPEDRLSPRRISPQILQQERPASAYPVCLFPSTDLSFVYNNRQQCNDNYRDCVPSDLKPLWYKIIVNFPFSLVSSAQRRRSSRRRQQAPCAM